MKIHFYPIVCNKKHKKTHHSSSCYTASEEKTYRKIKAIPMGQHFAKCAVWWQNELGGHSAPYIPQLYSKPVFSSTTGKSPKQGFISGNTSILRYYLYYSGIWMTET